MPDSFIYLFSVLSLLFFSLSLRKYSALFLNLSILFSSLSFWSDYQTVLVISYMIVRLVGCYKIGEITKSQFIQFILTLSCCIISVGFIVSVVHIGLQCGPSNVYSLSQKLFNEFIDLFKFSFDKDFLFTAKFYIPIVTQKIKIVPNFTFLVLFILGFIASVFRKKWNLSLHIILAVLSSLLYNDYIMNHLQMCYIFGLLSIVPFIEQIVGSHSKKVSYLIMALSIALYLGGFPSTYGRQLSFRHMDEL
ncbi:hypothetical protein TRFO_39896 [Tritrichomonas foetus]|uniref:Uncharacterized protein n=1 Tax=Tritrichomonas foetus TaxID=1144522 RepID=A0A1J4J399_9EUKA|nr:hypothetical protein TRFO_39896 [Tritrichomonas foetus]|eukprot:OHS93928.1 hypothetical protein TRFO_39896 [Tritrichomonas foetus]